MLVGREAETRRIGALLAAARTGESGSLVLRGEPGVGKTALLRHAVARAADLTVLEVRGLESHAELPFAALAVLLAPVLDRLGELPEAQAHALAAALGRARPEAADPLTVYGATLTLLAAAAEDRPVLAVVDDVQWLDRSTAEALLVVARRLGSEGIALLMATRAAGPAADDLGSLPQVVLAGLDEPSALTLLADAAADGVGPGVAARLHALTGGNPLALLETCRLLTPAHLRGERPLEEPVPVGAALQRASSARVAALGAGARQALLVVAASESGDAGAIARALEVLGSGLPALEPAEAADLVVLEPARIAFRNPLLRSSVYHDATPPQRRAVHAALAAALTGPLEAGARAWHLARAAVAPDERTASALEEAAAEARRRGSPAAAARAFELSAQLSTADGRRGRRLFEAAVDAELAGQPERAVALLEEALRWEADPLARADVQNLRGRIDGWRRPTSELQRALLDEAARVEAADPGRSVLLRMTATTPSFVAGDVARALEIAEDAFALAARVGGPLALVAALPLACAVILRGDVARGRELLAGPTSLVEQGEVVLVAPLAGQLMQCLAWVEDVATADRVGQRVITQARRTSAPRVLRLVLAFQSELDSRQGRWSEAYAHAAEAIALARDARSDVELAYGLTCLARVEAGQGHERSCREHVGAAHEVFAERGAASTLTYGPSVLGLLELGLGRLAEAIEHLELVAALSAEHGVACPTVVPWRPDLVEAYARAGRTEEAEGVLARLEEEAERTGSAWAAGAAARCRGLLGGDDDFEAHFERALAGQQGAGAVFERARTELCRGERLRRARRRVEARTWLRRAAVGFERVGARPWAERAEAELAATGERARPRTPWVTDELTPQELQVALAVAEGATNREAAAALFLSPKTVEFHLGRVYRKLGVRSRTELARHVLTRQD